MNVEELRTWQKRRAEIDGRMRVFRALSYSDLREKALAIIEGRECVDFELGHYLVYLMGQRRVDEDLTALLIETIAAQDGGSV